MPQTRLWHKLVVKMKGFTSQSEMNERKNLNFASRSCLRLETLPLSLT